MKLIVVTPAGRERYLRLLSHYVLGSPEVSEWQLWDNCRNESDRSYLRQLAASDPRCSLKHLPSADGSVSAVGEFFRFCDDGDALYLKLDDDIVYVEPGFFEKFKARALAARGSALWLAPVIINNAVCGAMLKHLSNVVIEGHVSAQANCPSAWAFATFPLALHPVFIEAVRHGRLGDFRMPDREIRMCRFSMNAIAFFGSEILELGDLFLSMQDGDEEWLTAALPAKLDRCGRVFGDLIVSHFSFYTQERRMLQTAILDAYYELAALPPARYEKPADRSSWTDRFKPWRRLPPVQEPYFKIYLR